MVFTAIIQNVHGTKLADRDSPDTVYHITSRLRTSAPPLVSAFLCWSFPFVWLPFSPSLPPSLLLLAFSLLFHLFHPDLPSFLPVIDRANNTSAVFWPIALKPPHSPSVVPCFRWLPLLDSIYRHTPETTVFFQKNYTPSAFGLCLCCVVTMMIQHCLLICSQNCNVQSAQIYSVVTI